MQYYIITNFVVCLHLKLEKTQTKNFNLENIEIRKCLVIFGKQFPSKFISFLFII
jgi:hypothetical protein